MKIHLVSSDVRSKGVPRQGELKLPCRSSELHHFWETMEMMSFALHEGSIATDASTHPGFFSFAWCRHCDVSHASKLLRSFLTPLDESSRPEQPGSQLDLSELPAALSEASFA